MEHSDRDQELREFLDNRENRIALAWMAIEGRENRNKPSQKIKRPVLWTVLFLAYVAFLLYLFLN
jgi:hypothetical protein